ncbi:MAG TPA: PH domain-containing protein [Thermoplasmata archaeon]|nr:PH domain-containing protein [Thermoplasmata archaeon]
MPYCPSCGRAVDSAAQFCDRCGRPLPVGQPPLAGAAASAPLSTSSPPAGGSTLSDAYLAAHRPLASAPAELPFRLQEGEAIYRDVKPQPALRIKLLLLGPQYLAYGLIWIIPLSFSYVLGGSSSALSFEDFVLFWLLVLLAVVAVGGVYAWVAFSKFHYWVTNQRTVAQRGAIGYTLSSIPLETVADVVVARSVLDRLLGISTIAIQPFGGAAGHVPFSGRYGRGYGGGNMFAGLIPAEAPDVQQLIFHLRDARRRATGRLI